MIETRCNHCQTRFRVAVERAGSKTTCPKCSRPFVIAAVVAPSNPPAAAVAQVEQWQAKSPDGALFGPIDKQQLDAWVSDGRLTAEFQLLRVGDDQWVWAADIYPELTPEEAPPAIDVSPAVGRTPSAGAPAAKYRPRFQPRKYPAMTAVMWVCYVLAGIFTLSLAVSLILLTMGAGLGIAHSSELEEVSAMSTATALAAVATIIAHGLGILSCVYAAEMVKIVQDIQLNTQEAAHFARIAGDA